MISVSALLTACVTWLAIPVRRGLAGPRWRMNLLMRMGELRAKSPEALRQKRAENARRVTDFTQALAGLLKAGHAPLIAWERLGAPTSLPGWRAAYGDVGDSPAAALRAAATSPGCAALARVSVCWEVAEQSGASLVASLQCIVTTLRSEADIAAEIEGQLSGPRATVRLLLTLPCIAVVMGEVLGAGPLGVLLTTPHGLACLLGGVALLLLGWQWVERQINSVSRGVAE